MTENNRNPRMETIKIHGTITATSPLHTGADVKNGIQLLLRTVEYFVNGELTPIPVFTGNSPRGKIRRMISQDLLEQTGYTVKSLRLHHLLTSGGNLEPVSSSDVGTFNLEHLRMIRENLPLLSILGCSFMNNVVKGKLEVGFVEPICAELKSLHGIHNAPPVGQYLTDIFFTRKDEKEIPAEMLATKTDAKAAQQMKYKMQCFAAGTPFHHQFTLKDMTDLEKSCFARMMELWQKDATIGARAAVGLGNIKLDYPDFMNYSSSMYLQWIQDNKQKIIAVLEKIDNIHIEFKPKKPVKQKSILEDEEADEND